MPKLIFTIAFIIFFAIGVYLLVSPNEPHGVGVIFLCGSLLVIVDYFLIMKWIVPRRKRYLEEKYGHKF